MEKKIRTAVYFLTAAMLAWGIIAAGAGWMVNQRLMHRLKIEGSAEYRPEWFRPSYELRNAQVVWRERVKILSGSVRVEYDLLSVLGGVLRVRISGRGVQARLLGEWAKIQGVEETPVESFYAQLGVGREGLRAVEEVDVRSPAFQFRIRKSET